MTPVQPEVRLIARPQVDWRALKEHLIACGVTGDWWDAHAYHDNDPEDLAEIAGRTCYRSWEPGLNPNVTRVRTSRQDYLENILKSKHGSVLEHVSFTFAIRNVSRVLTHELVRHRPGTAISQESMRFVRFTEIPFWLPDWARDDVNLARMCERAIDSLEELQEELADVLNLSDPALSFFQKKQFTSFMRRFLPEGTATTLIWSANIRALRHVIAARTDVGAEEEIRIFFSLVAKIVVKECPVLFGDFTEQEDGSWIPRYEKV